MALKDAEGSEGGCHGRGRWARVSFVSGELLGAFELNFRSRYLAAVAVTSLATFVAPNAADAAPIYLKCVVTGDGESHSFDLSLDEATGTVNHIGEKSGRSIQAIFSPDYVIYVYSDFTIADGGLRIRETYQISRVDLSVIRKFSIIPMKFTDKIESKESLSYGTCELTEAKKRKF